MPGDATSANFSRRLASFRGGIRETVKDAYAKNMLIELAREISNLQTDRHHVTHGLWKWFPATPKKLGIYSFRPGFEFDDEGFSHKRLAQLADRIGAVCYELTYRPRRGLKKFPVDELQHAYLSRQFLLLGTGSTPEELGLDFPTTSLRPSPPQSSSKG